MSRRVSPRQARLFGDESQEIGPALVRIRQARLDGVSDPEELKRMAIAAGASLASAQGAASLAVQSSGAALEYIEEREPEQHYDCQRSANPCGNGAIYLLGGKRLCQAHFAEALKEFRADTEDDCATCGEPGYGVHAEEPLCWQHFQQSLARECRTDFEIDSRPKVAAKTASARRKAAPAFDYDMADFAKMAAKPLCRADCANVPRPCPYVSCKWHLYIDVTESGSLKVNFPALEPHELPARGSCALDVAEDGRHSLYEVCGLLNVTRERVRQIEEIALGKLRDAAEIEDWDGDG
jgi:hypothetical protein